MIGCTRFGSTHVVGTLRVFFCVWTGVQNARNVQEGLLAQCTNFVYALWTFQGVLRIFVDIAVFHTEGGGPSTLAIKSKTPGIILI